MLITTPLLASETKPLMNEKQLLRGSLTGAQWRIADNASHSNFLDVVRSGKIRGGQAF